MPTIHKVLGQAAPANTNVTTLYTCPTSTETIVSTLTITNVSTAIAKPTVYIRVNGATASTANILIPDFDLAAKSFVTLTLGITLSSSDIISVSTNTASSLNFMLFGQEKN